MDSSGFRRFLGLVKFSFSSERVERQFDVITVLFVSSSVQDAATLVYVGVVKS